MYKNHLKFPVEFIVTVFFILLAAPVLIVAAVLLLFANQGSIFFFQDRPGKGGKIFKVIKFKTMNDKRDKDGKLLPDHIRLTTVGRIVRASSVDEIPQLFNVLKGDMSLIGPRPLLVKYLPLYTPEQFRRHEVRPGMTGWAQINGRNAISWKQKFEYDVWYVDNCSFWLDIKIIFITLKKVIVRVGINSQDEVTTKPFTGNEND